MVVFPTPPFWLATAMTLGNCYLDWGTFTGCFNLSSAAPSRFFTFHKKREGATAQSLFLWNVKKLLASHVAPTSRHGHGHGLLSGIDGSGIRCHSRSGHPHHGAWGWILVGSSDFQ